MLNENEIEASFLQSYQNIYQDALNDFGNKDLSEEDLKGIAVLYAILKRIDGFINGNGISGMLGEACTTYVLHFMKIGEILDEIKKRPDLYPLP